MIGEKLGQYHVLEKLGEGGMGAVYLARDSDLDRKVALKFVKNDALDENARQRLIREAKASAAIDHPSVCRVYEIGERDGRPFIAMEYVEGETLQDVIARGPIPSDEARRIARDVLAAVADAHARGILHRDLKPSNIMLTTSGHVKVMDFGLATRASRLDGEGGTEDETWTRMTQRGTVIGTLLYMSPEQLRGEALDAASDMFAFGIILHEMLSGEHPFRRSTSATTAAAILKEQPPSLSRRNVPPKVRRAAAAALARDGDKRPSASELLNALRLDPGSGKARWLTAAALIGATVAASALWMYHRSVAEREALASLSRIQSLGREGDFVTAFELALRAEEILGPDAVADWMPRLSDRLTVRSDPPGASVSLRRYDPSGDEAPEGVFVGTTPIDKLRLARADYIVTIAKEGYATAVRPFSSRLARGQGRVGDPARAEEGAVLDVSLHLSSEVPEGMVHVPGGNYVLVGRGVQNAETVELDDFFIDRFEVSHHDFKRFVDAGGYGDDTFWEHTTDAREELVDRTGLPGPRKWVNQQWPEGKADHPVTGVSWYEADAFCAFEGKTLPTAYQWEKAARNGLTEFIAGQVMPWGIMNLGAVDVRRANFAASGTVPVDSMDFGVSPFGAHHMAGNVEEWLLNRKGEDFATAGGSWSDPAYIFGEGTGRPGSTNSPGLGFRCVLVPDPSSGDQGADPLYHPSERVRLTPVDDETYRGFLEFYRYDKKPLEPRVEDTFTAEDGAFTRHRVTFNGVEDRIVAYLYLPQRSSPPHQTIFYVVSAAVLMGQPLTFETEWMLETHIRSGRAVFAVVPRGTHERPWPGHAWTSASITSGDHGVETVNFRERILMHVTEFRIGLDYLETRDDIDASKIAYVGLSYGGGVTGIALNAVDSRFASVAFFSGGIHPVFDRMLPEINPNHFAPRMKGPKLLVNGRFDEVHPIEVSARPLFDAWPEPKRPVTTESGHAPPIDARGRILKDWLDETLGPVH